MLIAIRKSSKAFDDELMLKSSRVSSLFREKAAWEERLAIMKERLDTRLFELVADVYDDTAKRKDILQLKRDLQKGRKLKDRGLRHLDAQLAERIRDYQRDLEHCRNMLEEPAREIREETRAHIEHLKRDVWFKDALSYSSPDLYRDLERFRDLPDGRLVTKFTRGLYGYGSKWAGKANPLHFFAGLYFPKSRGNGRESVGPMFEIQVDVGYINAVERHILEMEPVSDAYGLMLSPFKEEDGSFHFLVVKGDERRHRSSLLKMPINPILLLVRDYLSEHSTNNLGHLVEHLCSRLPVPEAKIRNYLNLLLQEGILKLFIIQNFPDFGQELAERAPEFKHLAAGLDKVHTHVQPLEARDDLDLETHLDAGILEKAGIKQPFHVNLYFQSLPMPDLQDKLDPVLADLRRLKPFFTRYNNFTRYARIRGKILENYLETKGKASYMDCSFHLLHEKDRLINLESRETFNEDWPLSDLEGNLSHQQLDALLEERGLTPGSGAPLECNGVLDFQTNEFAITNLWDGNGHFVSRYRLRDNLIDPLESTDDLELVQIYDLLGTNKNMVAVACETGFSLDRRYRGLFHNWIDPWDISIEWDGQRIVYRNTRTNRPLKFVWMGFVLMNTLPLPYQILLLDGADVYHNPFSYQIPDINRRYRQGLKYGRVVLRRPFWTFSRGELPARAKNENLLAFTWRFRTWLQEVTGLESRFFYYRLHADDTGSKPSFLDTDNPQSIGYLLNASRKMKETELITLEKMEPGPEGLYKLDGEAFTTEILLEL